MTNIRILLCDDEKVIRTGLRKMLTQAYGGCVEIAEAADGQAGCAMYEIWRPDLVITDIRMPGMDGLETLRHMKKIAPKLPVLLLTGHASLGVAVQGMDLGAYDYMLKPVAINELIIKMEEAVRAAA